jgi:DnaK suppressor protein
MDDADLSGVKTALQEWLRGLERELRGGLGDMKIAGDRDRTHDGDGASEDDMDCGVLELKALTVERIRRALGRLDGGQYGVCEECSGRIPSKRLLVLPFATRCRGCQERHDRPRTARLRGTTNFNAGFGERS